MLRIIPIIVVILAALACAADAVASPARMPVSLTDASVPPTAMAYVPGVVLPVRLQAPASVVLACPTGARPTDVSAYRWNGRALGAQRRTSAGAIWDVNRGPYHVGAVTYDRTTRVFRNESARPVLVAVWCDAPSPPAHTAANFS